jgi:hypothetical protein
MGKGFYEYQADRMIIECENVHTYIYTYKAKICPKTGNEDQRGRRGIALLFL